VLLVLAMACGAAQSAQAQGGPPLETDDPGTPGPGNLELNVSVEAERESVGTFYDAPRLDFNVGVGARLQLKLEVPWRVADGAAGPAQTGMGNPVLGVKWRFAQTHAVAASVYPQATLEGPESSRGKGLADSGTALLLPIEVAWDPGPVSLNGEVGYELSQDTPELVYGLALAYEAARALELLGECHGSGDANLARQGVLCGLGLRWALQDRIVLLAAYSSGVAGSAEERPDHRVYTGVQLRW